MKAVKPKPRPDFCSFCGKAAHEVFMLVAGPGPKICDECTALASQIITDAKIKAGVTAVIGRVAKSV